MVKIRKLMIFLLFLCLFTVAAYAAFGEWLSDHVLYLKYGTGSSRYLMAEKGADGDTYVVAYKDGYRLARYSGGNREFERALKLGGDIYSIEDLHVTASGMILLSVYERDEVPQSTGGLEGGGTLYCTLYASVDGDKFQTLLREECKGSGYRAMTENVTLSSISEYDGVSRFFLKSGDRWDLYSLTSEAALITDGSFTLHEDIVAGIVAEDGAIYSAEPGGTSLHIKKKDRGLSVTREETDQLYTRFMQSANGFAYVNGATGNLVEYGYDTNRLSALLAMENLPVLPSAVSSISAQADGTIFVLDSFAKLYEMTPGGSFSQVDLHGGNTRSIAVLTLTAIAIILLSYSFYFLFSEVRKLYFPLALRGLLSLGLIAYLIVTAGMMMYIKPEIASDIRSSAQSALMTCARQLANGDTVGVLVPGFDWMGICMVEDGIVAASNENIYSEGFRTNAPGVFAIPMSDTSEGVRLIQAADTVIYAAYVPLAESRSLVVYADGKSFETTIANSYSRIQLIVYALSAVVVLFASAVLNITASKARKITSGVDLLSNGRYDTVIKINSSDELSALSDSFNSLAESLNKRVIGDERRSISYHQFIPQQVVSLLGVDSIEDVNKSTAASGDMAMMVVWFGFPGEVYQSDPKTLFDNINEIIERTSGIVTKNGGTIYNFTYDGYDVVFPNNTESAVSAAVEIRQSVIALNKERVLRGAKPVTLHAAINKGNVMMGVVGDDSRMSPAAVSSCLSTARSLLQLSQSLDSNILCTTEVADEAEGYFVRYIGKYLDAGSPIRVYEIADGDEYDIRAGKEKMRRQFGEGVLKLYGHDYSAAKRLFMDIARNSSGDGVTRYYLFLSDKLEKDGAEEIYLN